MTDIFLEDRPSNRAGCLRLLIIALVVCGVVYFVSRGCKDEGDGTGTGNDPAQMDPDAGLGVALTPTDGAAAEARDARSSDPRLPESDTRSNTSPNLQGDGPGNPDSAQALIKAQEFYQQKNYAEARSRAFDALDRSGNTADREAAEAFLNQLHIEMILNPIPMEEKVDYRIKSGDLISKLSRTYKTTDELIMKSNNIRDAGRIQIGDGLRIMTGTFKIYVSKTRNDLRVTLNDRFFKRYSVGTGEYAKTPVGTFTVKNRIVEPDWWRPDGQKIAYGHPDHLLGTRWLGLSIKSYGIHGIRADEVNSIGTQSSAGCIRMLNPEVEELFDFIPTGTEVIIEE